MTSIRWRSVATTTVALFLLQVAVPAWSAHNTKRHSRTASNGIPLTDSQNDARATIDWSKNNAPQEWRRLGLQSASIHVDNYDNNLFMADAGRAHYFPSPRISCPVDCKCGIITGVTCYSSSDSDNLPNDFPTDLQVLTLFGYKNIGQELLKLDELQELSIYDGKLQHIPALPLSITHLRITNSNLKSVKNIESLPFLQLLNIAHNNITDGDLTSLSHLLSLDLSNNPLERVPQLPTRLNILKMVNVHLEKQEPTWGTYLPNLRRLSLMGMQSTLPPYLTFPKLEYLDLSHSRIKLLPYLSGLPKLKVINLSHTDVRHAVQGHFEGPQHIKKVDLSYTRLTKLPDKIFINIPTLRELYLHNSDIQYIKDYTFSGLINLEKLIVRDNPYLTHVDDKSLLTLKSLKLLDLSRTPIKVLPSSLNRINLTHLIMDDVTVLCDCHSHWLPSYATQPAHTNVTGLHIITCQDGTKMSPLKLEMHLEELQCTAPDIISPPDVALRRGLGKTALLECNSTGVPYPIIIWHSPDKKYYTFNKTEIQPWYSDKFKYMLAHVSDGSAKRIQPLKSGQLLIQNLTRGDVGLYRCIAANAVASVTSTTSLWLTVDRLEAFKIETLLFGLACAMTFLLTTLIVQLIRYIMDRMGWECCCCRGRLSSRAQQVKRLLESVESYKSHQLDKLKENYNGQVVTIKESCYQQMERLGESYTQQCKNMQSIKDYSAQQITTARDQYVEQINRVRDYSVGQMNKVSENYVFQRQRIRKFSAHQMFKLRETYKYQQKTLNKIMENIPDLYLQNCRTGGNCNRSDSIIFDDEIHGIDAYYRLDFLNPVITGYDDSDDFFYTPSSTLTKTQRQYFVEQHRRQHSSSSTNTTDYHEAAMTWATNTPTNVSPGNSPSHTLSKHGHHPVLHTRSLSISTSAPKTGSNASNSKAFVPTHRRALSANFPTVKIQRSSPPLMEKTYWTPLARSPCGSDTGSIQARIMLSDACNSNFTQCQSDTNNALLDTDSRVPKDLPCDAQLNNINLASDRPDKDEITMVNAGENSPRNSVIDSTVNRDIIKSVQSDELSSVKDKSEAIDTERGSIDNIASSLETNREETNSSLSQLRIQLQESFSGSSSPQGSPYGSCCSPGSPAPSPPPLRDSSALRRTSLSREGSKELEARCVLPSLTEDKEPSLSSTESQV